VPVTSRFHCPLHRSAVLLLLPAIACVQAAAPGAGPPAATGGEGGDSPGSGGSGGSRPVDAAVPDRPPPPDAPPPDVSPPPFTRPVAVIAGRRLKGLMVQSPDGARQRWGLYDTMLAVRCTSQRADDGKQRCLPVAPGTFDLNVSELVYADAACSELALPEDAACAGGYGFKDTTAGRSIYKLGPAVMTSAVYHRSGAACEPVMGATPRRLFTLGAVVPAATFVERLSARTDGPTTQRLHAYYDEYADSTRALATDYLWDLDLKAYCWPRLAADGSLRCLPAFNLALLQDAYFTDDQCGRPAAYLSGTATPTVVVKIEGNGCEARNRVFAVGAKLAPTAVWRRTGQQCAPVDPAASTSMGFYEVGEELAPNRFPTGKRVALARGRLEERYFVSDEGVTLREYMGLWDTKLGLQCTFERTSAGRRCVPLETRQTFADVGCSTQAVTVAAAACGVMGAASSTYGSLIGGPWCARQLQPVAMGDRLDLGNPARVYRRGAGGACSVVSTSSEYFTVGMPSDLALFEPGNEGMD
jgi:hypothetical protein